MLEEPQTAPESLPTRKRSKASEENDEERSKKRSRGRPRLDTRDETAQDGMLEGAPEVARRLNDTTRKFLSLTRKSADDSNRDGIEDTPVPAQAQEQVVSQPPGRHPSGSDSSTSGSGSGEFMLQNPPGFNTSQEKSLSTPQRPDATIRQQATPPLKPALRNHHNANYR
uniref:Uncharacterized protein n=1 Tax=Fusarium oxysporum (strain Fo5176) TaxID=660025 RepID=A0A0D2XW24_FUSOF